MHVVLKLLKIRRRCGEIDGSIIINLIQKADNISILCKKVAATSRSIRRAITTTRLIGTVGLK